MSRSKRDGAGKRINGEIMGRGTAKIANGQMLYVAGGDDVGSPSNKKDAKRHVSRQRRLDDKRIVKSADE